LCSGGVFDTAQKLLDIEVPPMLAQLDRLAPRKWPEVFGKIGHLGHGRGFDEYRKDEHLTPQGGLDLQTDEILRIIETALAAFVAGLNPVAPNHQNKDVARIDRPRERLDEIIARLEPIDIAENPVRSEMIAKPVEQATRVTGSILAPITDKYSRHNASMSAVPRARIAWAQTMMRLSL
jgi:hypothetical protein